MKRALVFSLICVLGFAFAGMSASLTGSWDTDVTIDVTQSDFSEALTLKSILTVNYIVGDWTFTSITYLKDTGWFDQDFNAVGLLGAFNIVTALDLNPDATFGDLDLTVSLSFSGVAFELDVNLIGGADTVIASGPALVAPAVYPLTFENGIDLFVDLTASGVVGDVTLEATLSFGDNEGFYLPDGTYTFGLVPGDPVLVNELNPYWVSSGGQCDLDWSGLDITIGFPFCCVALEGNIVFSCDGLDEISFSFEGITVPNLPWLTIDGSVTFDLVAGKTFVVEPTLDFGADVCFDLYWNLNDGWDIYGTEGMGFEIDSIQLDGIGLSCEIGGVTFEGITYWGRAIVNQPGTSSSRKEWFPGILGGFLAPNGLTAINPYYEAYKISTTDDACCGPFGFSFAVYFDNPGILVAQLPATGVPITVAEVPEMDSLFDVALFIATVELEVASQFTFDMGLSVAEDGFTEWTIGFLVTW